MGILSPAFLSNPRSFRTFLHVAKNILCPCVFLKTDDINVEGLPDDIESEVSKFPIFHLRTTKGGAIEDSCLRSIRYAIVRQWRLSEDKDPMTLLPQHVRNFLVKQPSSPSRRLGRGSWSLSLNANGFENGRMHKIMISYAWRNSKTAMQQAQVDSAVGTLDPRRLAQDLSEIGFGIWLDTNQLKGELFGAIKKAVKEADCVVCCVSDE